MCKGHVKFLASKILKEHVTHVGAELQQEQHQL